MNRLAGFTLVEIIVVILIIGVMAALLIPRLPDVGGWRLKSAVRKLSRSISVVYDKAATSKLVYRMTFDLEEGRYFVSLLNTDGEFEKREVQFAGEGRLPDGLAFLSVQVPGREKVDRGLAHIHFFPTGFVEFSAIHIIDKDEAVMTLLVHPLTGRVKIKEGYHEIGVETASIPPGGGRG
ncbi:MAG: prepilin-type N-terminal cleavage/methylation domain-containing protein [Nitrospinota bacterium]|nr:prepilin-type N-terminal cleavage/methylation domain-containing protein [Nitrospinota bacterium]